MANLRNIKLPLAAFGFRYLCNFIGKLYEGLNMIAQDVDDNTAEITALTNEIIAGEVTAMLSTQGGIEIATQNGAEIFALRILS